MILETLNPGIHKVRLEIKEMIYGNDSIDKLTGWDTVNPTLLKVHCKDCTLMVFGKKEMNQFKSLNSGDIFDALVHDGRYPNVFKFKYFLDNTKESFQENPNLMSQLKGMFNDKSK